MRESRDLAVAGHWTQRARFETMRSALDILEGIYRDDTDKPPEKRGWVDSTVYLSKLGILLGVGTSKREEYLDEFLQAGMVESDGNGSVRYKPK